MPPKKKQKLRPDEKVDCQAGEETANLEQPPPNSNKEKRAFRCQFCAKEFLRKEHLQRHERLHTKEKPFRCTACSEGFNRSDLLARHTRLVHGSAIINGDPEASTTPSRLTNTPLPVTSPDGSFIAFPEESAALNHEVVPPSESLPWAEPTSNFDDFALFIDSVPMPYGSNLPTFPFAQPPIDALNSQPARPHVISSDPVTSNPSTPRLFDEFTSTFPSFEPSASVKSSPEPWKITEEIWNHLLAEIQKFAPVLPPHFFLPSRHTMTRYIATYFSGFHRHLPFLHIPTFSPTKCPVELILAMATIGAQSAFDHDNAIMFYRTSYAIVQESIRYRKAQRLERLFPTDSLSTESHTPQDSQPEWTVNQNHNDQFDPLPIAQTLLILMAMATWGNSKAIFNEAVGLQNIVAIYVREEKLLDPQTPLDMTWHGWIQAEGFNRIISIIFCFFIFHTIIYDTPPPILNSELKIYLPSRETDWEATSEVEWKQARSKSQPETTFQSSFSLLFSKQPDKSSRSFSSLGGYTLILALIQHIYFLRETSKHRPGSDRALSPTDITEVEQALRNWQSGWYQDPESYLGPGSPKGPISFNSTALLRMAYIRLNVDVGPWRALNTHDPHDIAASMHQSPPLIPNRKLTRAVLYSAHALSIPVKIGVNIVARNQAFAWSLQHSLCALECAFVVSRWLIAIQPRISGGTLDEEEARLLAYLTDMVAEADSVGEFGPQRFDLCTRVIKIWAKLLSGEAVWDVVRMIGKALGAYARILESRSM